MAELTDVIESHVQVDGPEFGANRARMQQLVAELRDNLALARAGGGRRALERQRQQGKLPVHDRIDRLAAASAFVARALGRLPPSRYLRAVLSTARDARLQGDPWPPPPKTC